MEQAEIRSLSYTVVDWSSFSNAYHPNNIKVNNPTDQASRWSSAQHNQSQFIVLKLDRPAIVKSITFGKYENTHVCNLKEFKVYGGLEAFDQPHLLLTSGLRNDNEPETFQMKSSVHRMSESSQEVPIVSQYIKIAPLLAWGQNFNYSIWFVELQGADEKNAIADASRRMTEAKETEAIRLCLKHFRQKRYLDCFEQLYKRTKVSLESKELTDLYETIVTTGNFELAEEKVKNFVKQGCFREYITMQPYTPKWQKITPVNSNGDVAERNAVPGMRGGHQMNIDTRTRTIFMFGGWDSRNDLGDFWMYKLDENRWTMISSNVAAEGGPCARSCHKMCYDDKNQKLYVLGRYVDKPRRRNHSLASDFFCYDVTTNTWECLSLDTKADGGPVLIYDHQIACHSASGRIFVCGGRTITKEGSTFSGLYCYDCQSKKWTLLREDFENKSRQGEVKFVSRMGHSMVLDQVQKKLYVFAGQRQTDYLADFIVYDLENDSLREISRDTSKQGGPDPGFTQRATIDTTMNELFVLSGLVQDQNSRSERRDFVSNSFWVYNIERDSWLPQCRTSLRKNDSKEEPCPRFAHQLVYEPVTKTHYLFGGNPGEPDNDKMRLSDFWTLKIARETEEELLQTACYVLRKQRFQESCRSDPRAALRFLQRDLAEVLDRENQEQSAEFHKLATNLFAQKDDHFSEYDDRVRTYEQVIRYFPDHMKQPTTNLTDLIDL